MNEREYYRSNVTGDLGYLVERDGKSWVKLDRSGPEVLKEFSEGLWAEELHRAPLNQQQLGKLAYEFDQLLCRTLGRGQEANRDWIAMQNEEKATWMTIGPCDSGIRDALFDAVLRVLKEYTEE